jgi:hypothetical protein
MCDVCADGLPEDQIDLDEMERKIIMKKLYDAILCMIKVLISVFRRRRLNL